MPAALLKAEIDVTNRLHDLGFKREQLLEIVAAMVGARAGATENDPPGAGAWSSWRMGTRRGRDVLGSDSTFGVCEKSEDDQISSVVNRALGVRLIVSNTDDGTGLDNPKKPQNRSKKGSGTDRLVEQNQSSFLDKLDATIPFVPKKSVARDQPDIVNWYLCVHVEAEEVRAEISCPTAVDGGFFADFEERILIIGPDDGWSDKLRDQKPDDGDVGEFAIEVTRK